MLNFPASALILPASLKSNPHPPLPELTGASSSRSTILEKRATPADRTQGLRPRRLPPLRTQSAILNKKTGNSFTDAFLFSRFSNLLPVDKTEVQENVELEKIKLLPRDYLKFCPTYFLLICKKTNFPYPRH